MHESDKANVPLVIDLDGTLIRTDSFLEALILVLRRNPLNLFRLPAWILRGKAYTKSRVVAIARPDVALLPYRQEVLDLISKAKQEGRHVVLASGSDSRVVEAVAGHLKLFDDVIGTSGDRNMTRDNKREALEARYGEYDYVGDSSDDAVVLNGAREAFAPAGTTAARQLERQGRGTVIGDAEGFVGPLLRAMRVHQYAKNLLIFVPLFLAQQLTDAARFFDVVTAFIAFSLCASGVYIVNDILDIEPDRRHASKRRRPFASGDASPIAGVLLALICFSAGIVLAVGISQLFLLTLLAYIVATTAYSFYLKRAAILDTLTLAMLYTMRLVAGGVAAGVELSFWLLAFSIFIFLSLALVKRCSELGEMADRGVEKASGRGYSTTDLELLTMMGIASAFTAMLVLALYINAPEVLALYEHPQFLWALCPVLIYWLARVWLLTRRGDMHEDPIVFAIRDRRSYLLAGFAALAVALASGKLF